MIDLLDLVRSIAAAAARAAENKHYPSPCSQGSPMLASVRQACVERGYSGDGLAVPGMAAPSAQPAAAPDGWQSVPAQLTPTMLAVSDAGERTTKKIWRDMLAVAPAAPAAQGDAKDTCAEMRALCSACGGTGDVHGLDGEWRGQCTCVHAWQQRAEKAEADLKQVNEWRAAALAENMQLGERWAKRITELEVQLARRGAPLSPEPQQASAAACAAGQSIAATPTGLVFMNNGTEQDSGELDCPACGGSGHAGDLPAGSAP